MNNFVEEDIKTLIKDQRIKKAYVMATFLNKVCIGYFNGKEICFEEDVNYNLCTEIRVFNKEKEIRMIKVEGKIYSKIITDEEIYKIEDNEKILVGEKLEKLNDECMYIRKNKLSEVNNSYIKFTTLDTKSTMNFITYLADKINKLFGKTVEKKALPSNQKKDDIRLIVRNYCGEDAKEQVVITESRYVEFCIGEKECVKNGK